MEMSLPLNCELQYGRRYGIHLCIPEDQHFGKAGCGCLYGITHSTRKSMLLQKGKPREGGLTERLRDQLIFREEHTLGLPRRD